MKKLLMVLLMVAAAGCSKDRNLEATVTAIDGRNGHSIVSQYGNAESLECSNSGSRLDMFIDLDDSLSVTEGDLYANSLVVCNGANGLQGLQGLPGVAGTPGAPGEQGPQGIPGAQGPQGAQGAAGPQGLQGVAGTAGAVGPQGLPGSPGPVGPQGPTGPQGIQGPSGSSGAIIRNYSSSSCTLITGTSSYAKASSTNYGLYTSSSCHSSSKFAEVSEGESYWVSSNSLAIHSDSALKVITFN